MISKIPSVGILFCGSVATYSLSKTIKAMEMVDCHECHVKRLPKAKELPLYEKDENLTIEYDKTSELPLISEISKIRSEIFKVASYAEVVTNKMSHIYETGLAHSQSTLDYVNDEERPIPRVITIASAGLLGILLARKGGYFKKIVYGSTGSGLVFSAFYPSIAKEYISHGYEFVKEHTSNALEQYGGYDTKKLAETANEKIESLQSTMRLEFLTNKLKENFEKNKEALSQKLNSANKEKGDTSESDRPTK